MRSAPFGDVGGGGNLLNLMQFCLLRKGKGKEVRLIKKKKKKGLVRLSVLLSLSC